MTDRWARILAGGDGTRLRTLTRGLTSATPVGSWLRPRRRDPAWVGPAAALGVAAGG